MASLVPIFLIVPIFVIEEVEESVVSLAHGGTQYEQVP